MEKELLGQELSKLVTDEQVKNAFRGTDFGNCKPRNIISNGLLKSNAGWWNGHTVHHILIELGLRTERSRITKRGRLYLYEAFKIKNH